MSRGLGFVYKRQEYDLSPAGEALYAALVPLAGWALQHRRIV
jgi:DNA-binding HxlR family transcriptional regulator